MDWFYLINVGCVYISWRWAMECFNDGLKSAGYVNLFASALNAAIVLDHFL